MNQGEGPRVALAGIVLESNAFAPVAGEEDFRSRYYFEGESLLEEAEKETSVIAPEMGAFVKTMNRTGPWTPVPALLTGCQPAGPVDHGFFMDCLERIKQTLKQSLPLDAVYLSQHGAMVSTETSDPDGMLIEEIRKITGPRTRILATLDLHANISSRMVNQSDLLVSYLTNPHVDMIPRGEEAAHALRKILAGADPQSAFIRLPLTPVSLTLLTREGPYADMIAYGQRRMQEQGGKILNVSVCGGFVFSDTPENGVAVIVTADGSLENAQNLCREIADLGWQNRQRFLKKLTSIEEALELAEKTTRNPQMPALIFSDAGDNPGGGGSGNTTWLVKSLIDAGIPKVFYGSFFDPELAAEAHRLGENAEFSAQFNRQGETEFSKSFSAQARVLKLSDGAHVGRLGMGEGRLIEMGPSAALEFNGPQGMIVIVISNRHQTADPVFFEGFGLEISDARIVVVKSRGHFRAGFYPWFDPEQVYEIDTPGLTAPVLERFQWKGLPRPVYPLDPDVEWNAADPFITE